MSSNLHNLIPTLSPKRDENCSHWAVGLTTTYSETSEARRPTPESPPADETRGMAAVARNREMGRAVNAQICLLAQPLSDISANETKGYFVCDCPDERCFAVVPMT